MATKQPRRSQAQRVIDRFGGVNQLTAALMAVGEPRDPSNLYRWTYPRSRGGTGGLVPNQVWPAIHAAARLEGIFLTSEDIDSRDL